MKATVYDCIIVVDARENALFLLLQLPRIGNESSELFLQLVASVTPNFMKWKSVESVKRSFMKWKTVAPLCLTS